MKRLTSFLKTIVPAFVGSAAALMLGSAVVLSGVSTIDIKDAAGVTKTYFVITNGAGNFLAGVGVCDGSAGAQCAAVKAASTAPAAADPAIVAAKSPNSPDLAPITAGSATATKSVLPGCQYNSTPPALTNGQQASAQFDINCRQLVKADTILNPTANFTRPGDTTAYAIGDMVANSTTAGSVTPMQFTVNTASGRAVYITRAKLAKSTTGVTAPNFRLHLYTASPTVASGDNAAYSTTLSGHFCDIDINMPTTTLFSDGNDGLGSPNIGTSCSVVPTAQIIYGLTESRGAYAPGNAEVFTFTLEVHEP